MPDLVLHTLSLGRLREDRVLPSHVPREPTARDCTSSAKPREASGRRS